MYAKTTPRPGSDPFPPLSAAKTAHLPVRDVYLYKNTYWLIVILSASMEVCSPASTDMVRSSISRETYPSYPIMEQTEKNWPSSG